MTAAAGLDALNELNEKCQTLCEEYGGCNGWRGFGRDGVPNYRLLYSSATTFENPGGVMFLGTNPGGNHEDADACHHSRPFSKSEDYSAYLDDSWDHWVHPGEKRRHPLQTAALCVAGKIVGGCDAEDPGRAAEDLLRGSPAGNLIPFRSESPDALPSGLRDNGLEIGWKLIKIAKPSLLVLFASNKKPWGWRWLMQQIRDNGREPRCQEHRVIKTLILREARLEGLHELPAYIFALPALNTKSWGSNSKVISCFEKRIAAIGCFGPTGDASGQG